MFIFIIKVFFINILTSTRKYIFIKREVKTVTTDRREVLNTYIHQKGEAKLTDLEAVFSDVSSMTLRRDLAYLEDKGEIIRVRGGAKSIHSISGMKEEVYSLRAAENIEAKVKIAKKAVGLIESGRSVFLDSGTTVMCLAKLIPDDSFYILTSGPNISLEIIKKRNPSVNLIGGQLNRDNISVSGMNSLTFVNGINIDIAFMATSAFSLEAGFTGGNFDECEIKKTIIQKAKKAIVLMDESKIDKNMPFTFAQLEDIDVLVSDKKLPDEVIKQAHKNHVQIY